MLRETAVVVLLLAVACSDGEGPAGTAPVEDAHGASGAGVAAQSACEGRWHEGEPGLRHRSLCTGGEATLHQVEVDPRRWSVDAARVAPTTAPAVARDRGATFAINANFFDPDRRPLGVIVSGGTVLQRSHPVSWQSIFYTTPEGKAAVVLPEQWGAVRDDATMAVQAGPRLVAQGRPTGATRGTPSLRSGVCLTADDRVVFFVTTARRLYDVDEMTDLAARSEERGGLGCRHALRRRPLSADVPGGVRHQHRRRSRAGVRDRAAPPRFQ